MRSHPLLTSASVWALGAGEAFIYLEQLHRRTVWSGQHKVRWGHGDRIVVAEILEDLRVILQFLVVQDMNLAGMFDTASATETNKADTAEEGMCLRMKQESQAVQNFRRLQVCAVALELNTGWKKEGIQDSTLQKPLNDDSRLLSNGISTSTDVPMKSSAMQSLLKREKHTLRCWHSGVLELLS